MDYFTTGLSNLFEPRTILTHKKYWRAIQREHPTFCTKIIVISKKKRSLAEISLRFATFCTKIKILMTEGSKKHCAGHSKSLRRPNLIKIEEKRAFKSNLSSTSAKIDRTEGFKKHCAGHLKPLRGPRVIRPCFTRYIYVC